MSAAFENWSFFLLFFWIDERGFELREMSEEPERLREMREKERLCMLVIFLLDLSGINISIIWLNRERWRKR